MEVHKEFHEIEDWHNDSVIRPLREMGRAMKTLLEGGLITSQERNLRLPLLPYIFDYSDLKPLIAKFGELFTCGNLLYTVVGKGKNILSSHLILFRQNLPVGVEEVRPDILQTEILSFTEDSVKIPDSLKMKIEEEKGERPEWFVLIDIEGLKTLKSLLECAEPSLQLWYLLKGMKEIIKKGGIKATPLPLGMKWLKEQLLSARLEIEIAEPSDGKRRPKDGNKAMDGHSARSITYISFTDRKNLSVIKLGGNEPFSLFAIKENLKPSPGLPSRTILDKLRKRCKGDILILLNLDLFPSSPEFMKRGELAPDIGSIISFLKGFRFYSTPPFILHNPIIKLFSHLRLLNLLPENLSTEKICHFIGFLESNFYKEGFRIRIEDSRNYITYHLRIKEGSLDKIKVSSMNGAGGSMNSEAHDFSTSIDELFRKIRKALFPDIHWTELLPSFKDRSNEKGNGSMDDYEIYHRGFLKTLSSGETLTILKRVGKLFFEREPFPYGAFALGIATGVSVSIVFLYILLMLI